DSQAEVPQRLRALWALQVTGGLKPTDLTALLNDRSDHVRAWSIQLLCEDRSPPAPAVTKFAELAKNDASPVVRLYLAAALQRLPLASRWTIAEGLVSHADAGDANLPLMDWYGIEPLVPADPARALKLVAAAKIPLLREFVGRRVAEDAVARADK